MGELNKETMEVLRRATQGKIVPIKKEVESFKELLGMKLIKHVGNNKYVATKDGLVAIQNGEVQLDAQPTKKVSAPIYAGKGAVAPKVKKPFAFKDKPKKTWEEINAEYSRKYKHYVPNSLSKATDPGTNKRTANIKCVKCGKTRTVYTSDVFQVKLCLACRDAKKSEQNAKSVAKLKAKAGK